jgi:hypothetical protein
MIPQLVTKKETHCDKSYFESTADFVNTSSGRNPGNELLYVAECAICGQPFFMLTQDWCRAERENLAKKCSLRSCKNEHRRQRRSQKKR